MSAQLKALYQLQVVDLELANTKKAEAALDDGSEKKQQVEAARVGAEEADKLLHEAAAELRDKELNLKSVETKKKSFQDKLYSGTVANAKELASINDEIAMLDRNKGKLEDRVLELMDIVEERKARAAEAAAALKQQEDELAAYLAKLEQEGTALAASISQLTAQRTSAAADVDAGLLKRYENLQSRVGVMAVGKVEEDSCGACRTGIMPYTIRELQSDKDIQACENCGRILYLEQ